MFTVLLMACGHWEGLSWTPNTRCVWPTAADVTLFPHLAKTPYSDAHTRVYTQHRQTPHTLDSPVGV